MIFCCKGETAAKKRLRLLAQPPFQVALKRIISSSYFMRILCSLQPALNI